MSVLINGNPIDGLAMFIRTVGISFVVLHVHGVIVGLRKTACDRLHDSKKSIEQRRAEEWVMDEVVPDAVDVRVDHQCVDESENQHHPQRRARVKEEKRKEISEVEQARECRNCVPARVGEEL